MRLAAAARKVAASNRSLRFRLLPLPTCSIQCTCHYYSSQRKERNLSRTKKKSITCQKTVILVCCYVGRWHKNQTTHHWGSKKWHHIPVCNYAKCSPFFGWPLQVTFRPMLWDYCPVCLSVCLSVTLVHYGQTVGCIKMPLGVVVGFSPGDIVLDRDPASPWKGA